ncbi:phage tail sheath family protein [Nocardioides seonyuensis]|uniref:Phage tail sheath family protein n=1 Tax=Nocardioides seonyuensis TaxID=2518371 RepID=A0A4P7IK66_9ACTN|nr:phage tail sheath C-terminal domain-containing protein [Nocardioides seonyuensis]QBX56727.1 phage tail sheath family protein [Nocardioides seonyuensis]
MTVNLTYPGVYVREVSSGVRTISGVATSITAFIGRTLRGPTDRPVLVQSFAEFSRIYGGLWAESPLGYAVAQYFLNGGRDALVGRVMNGAARATATLPTGFGLEAADEGAWGSRLRVRVEDVAAAPGEPADSRFNLLVKDTATGQVESFLNVSTQPQHPRFVTGVLRAGSELVRTRGAVPAARPTASGAAPAGADALEYASSSTAFGSDGSDGNAITDTQVSGAAAKSARQGLWLLDLADMVNLIVIPPLTRTTDVGKATWDAALGYAADRRAVVLVDPPSSWANPDAVISGISAVTTRSANGALYYPRVKSPDPLRENRPDTFAPSGAVAGVIARTDASRGIWKAPAGMEATLLGVDELDYTLTDGQNGRLNPLGVNCLRQFPVAGRVVWGARTLVGADQLASEWKYLSVRRTALYIEESLFRGTQWVVFEPNDEPLWAQIRLSVGSFMNDLFRQGAFQGSTPREAYLVKCDRETTTQHDINRGVVNISVGFAPLRPAEFVLISIQQLAGQIAV